VVALKATMPRKSSASAPATGKRCQVVPVSSERRITPFEPDAQTTGTGAPFASGVKTALTPRRFESRPLVSTFHHCASAGKTKSKKRKAVRMAGILAGG